MEFLGFSIGEIDNTQSDSAMEELRGKEKPDRRSGEKSDKQQSKRKRDDSLDGRSTDALRESRTKSSRPSADTDPVATAPDDNLVGDISQAVLANMMSHLTGFMASQVNSVPTSSDGGDGLNPNVTSVPVEVHMSDDGSRQPYVFGQDTTLEDDYSDITSVHGTPLADFMGCVQAPNVPSSSPIPQLQTLSPVAPSASQLLCTSGDDFKDAVSDMTSLFQQDDLCGAELPASLATAINDCLRKKPAESKIWDLADKIKWPKNVPNFQVPKMNPEVAHAMDQVATKFEKRLGYLDVWISKAMVPIATMLSDTSGQTPKDISSYQSQLGEVLHLLIAAFNHINQVRKEHLRNTLGVKDRALSSLCTWETAVGEKNLFPFNVQTKCRDLVRARMLGRGSFRSRGRFQGGGFRRGQARRGNSRPSRQFFGRGARQGRN